MSLIATKLYGIFFGTKVGEDEFGNKYYKSKKTLGFRVGKPNTERRWVIYKGFAEPSKVPPTWHAWLHQITDEIVKNDKDFIEKPIPNLTGTQNSYKPSSTIEEDGNAIWKP